MIKPILIVLLICLVKANQNFLPATSQELGDVTFIQCTYNGADCNLFDQASVKGSFTAC